MRRIDSINKINTYAARFVLEVQGFNATGQYHINIHAENFLIPVLNEVFGLELENLNSSQKKNFPAIDLADFNNRVAFQISATAATDKIKSTLQTFTEKKLDQYFDTVYVYILTEKKDSYPTDTLKKSLPAEFNFEPSNHVIDKDDLLQLINAITVTSKLELLTKIFEHEFSDVQIELRKKEFDSGFLKNEPEEIYPNMLEISFPDKFYIAQLNIDEISITAKVNDWLTQSGKRTIKKLKPHKLVKHALRGKGYYGQDYLLHEKSLYTFRNLHDPKEPMRQIVDIGTITEQSCNDFYEDNEADNRVFKDLLRRNLVQLCHHKGLQWFPEKYILRFANNRDVPNTKRIKWKGKKEATKTVIFEIISKKEGHIVCYRNLAFKPEFEQLGDKWFLVVNPTWSYTNPYGYKTSHFESKYMAGIKRLENNGSIYNYFRFFGYYLSYSDLFTKEYPYLKIQSPFTLTMLPALDEKSWRPVKLPVETTSGLEVTQDSDQELDKTLFD